MISTRAVQEYLNQPRDNHVWIKGLSEADLDREIAALNPRPRYMPALMQHQKACFLLGIAFPEMFFQLEMGTGKGQPIDSLVLTPSGWCQIGQLEIGDLVIGQNGLPTKVIGIFKKGILPTWKVSFNDRTSLIVDSDHLWAVQTPGHRWRDPTIKRPLTPSWKIKSTLELATHPLHSTSGNRRYHIPMVEPIVFPTKNFPLDPYLIGVLIGDGSYNSPCFTPGDIDVPAAIRQLGYSLTSHDEVVSTTSYTILGITPRWEKLGFKGKRSWERRIPPDYLFGSVTQRESLLQGLMDTDGYIGNKTATLCFTTTSEGLANDLKFLIQSLGGTTTIKMNPEPGYTYLGERRIGRPAWILTFKLPSKIKPFRARHPEYVPPSKYPPARLIDTIEFAGNREIVCIAVDSPDGLYVTENCIVTHNTLIALTLISYFLQLGHRKFLVQVPMDEAIDSWIEQIEEWRVPVTYAALRGHSLDKVDTWDAFDKGIGIGTYVGMSIALSDLVPRKKKRGEEWVPNKERIARFSNRLSGIVYDESTKVSHRGTLAYDVSERLSRNVPIRYALAGRPFGRDPQDLWAQFNLVDRGQTLSPTLGLFRAAFFRTTRERFSMFNYKLDPKRETDLARITAHRSIHYSADECIDLPDVTRIVKRVSFPADTETYYKRFIQEIISARGNLKAVNNVFLRMRQASSGFLGFKDEEDGERVELEFPHNPKFDLLMDLIEEVPDDQKMIIWYQFTHSGRKIDAALTKLKYKHGWLWGQTRDWTTIKSRFDTQRDFRFLLVQNQKGGYALNLQAANLAVFYESPIGAIDREQAERRIIRQGQTRKVRLYDLVTRNSMDEKILRYHKEGDDLMRTLVRDPAQLFQLEAA